MTLLIRNIRPGRAGDVLRMLNVLHDRGYEATPIDVEAAWVEWSDFRGYPFGWYDHTRLSDEELYNALREGLTEPSAS